MTRLRARRVWAATALPAMAAIVLGGCAGGGAPGGGGGGGGPTVPYGSSAAVYQSALADMSPVQLTVQTAAVTADRAGALLDMLDRITEYSGDKITFDVVYASGLVQNPSEIDDALVAGLIDVAATNISTGDSDFPASALMSDATVMRDTGYSLGWWASDAAFAEVAYSTPEIIGEWTAKALLPLVLLSPGAPGAVACNEPVASLADFAGKKIRSASSIYSRQIEALGAVPVQLETAEVYEGITRGTINCTMGTLATVTGGGLLDVVPHVTVGAETSFAGSASVLLAGTRVTSLPAAAQQLFLESAQYYQGASIAGLNGALAQGIASLGSLGGSWKVLAADAEAALDAENAKILAEIEAAPGGAGLPERIATAIEAWKTDLAELGYADAGPLATVPQWYTQPADPQPWIDAVLERIVTEYSPV